MGALASGFFENPLFVWFAGGLLLFGGLPIIAFHQYWSSPSAILISLFGWFLALRGLVLMAAPQLIEHGVAVSMDAMPVVRIDFGALVPVGLYLTMWAGSASPPRRRLASRRSGTLAGSDAVPQLPMLLIS